LLSNEHAKIIVCLVRIEKTGVDLGSACGGATVRDMRPLLEDIIVMEKTRRRDVAMAMRRALTHAVAIIAQ